MIRTICRGTLLMISLTLGMSLASAEKPAYEVIGSPSKVSESRGFVATEDSQGKKWLIGLVRDMVSDEGSRTSLLMIDPMTGASEQYFYTDPNTVTWDTFCLFISSKKKLYTTIGGVFLEFDIDQKKFTYVQPKAIDGNDHAFSIAEGPEGRIYFASYSDARLDVFDPVARKVSFVTRLDEVEKYPTTLSVDDDGWIYAGVGPAQGKLVAYHLETKERRQLVPESDLLQSSYAVVLKDGNGKIYGSYAPQMPYKKPYQRLRGGRVLEEENTEISKQTALFPPNSLYSFSKDHQMTFADGSRIEDFDVIGRTFTYRAADGVVGKREFTYDSKGPAISALAVGANGLIYGSTEHPMTLWQYDPKSGQSSVLGHLPALGGGNLTHLINWQEQLVSNSYSSGKVYSFDPSKAFELRGAGANPRHIDDSDPVISRPRAMLAHPDGKSVLSAGFPAYGRAGGGLLVHDMKDGRRAALYTDDVLCPGQSISAMTAHPDGDVFFGTSLLTPGGAISQAKEVMIGRFSWEKRTTEWLVPPVPGAQNIAALRYLNGRLIGVTSESVLFSMNPETREIDQRVSLTEWGDPTGRRGDTAFIMLPDGRLLLTMQKGILSVDPETLATRLLVASPIKLRDGVAVSGDRIYLAGFNELISFQIPPPEQNPSLVTKQQPQPETE